jgi:AcrR family transcriptional regulator
VPSSVHRAATPNAAPGGGRAYHHGDLENVLIEIALAQIARTGSVEFTVRGLAEEAGVSHVAVYRHFTDKVALLAAIAERGFTELVDALTVREQDPDLVGVFVEQGLAYVRFAVDHPGHFRVMWHQALADRAAFPALQVASQAAYECIRRTLSRLRAAGLTRAGHDVDDLTTFAWASVHGIAALVLEGVVAGGEEADRDAVIAGVAELVRVAVLA